MPTWQAVVKLIQAVELISLSCTFQRALTARQAVVIVCQMKQVVIYGLFDASKPDEIKYVGQTGKLAVRFQSHQYERDQATWKWVESVEASGSMISVKVLQTCKDKPEANKAEREWIAKFSGLLNKKLNGNSEFKVPEEELITLDDLESRYVKWAKITFRNDAQFLMSALGMNSKAMRRYFSEEEVQKHWDGIIALVDVDKKPEPVETEPEPASK